ncbi:MAG: lasso peptide biosynthesis B2 protein [Acidobacteriota bacterium]
MTTAESHVAEAPRDMRRPVGDLIELRPIDVTPAASWRERWATARSLFVLLVVDIALLAVKFKRLRKVIHRWPTLGAKHRDPKDLDFDEARTICLSVNRAAVLYPRSAWCLERSSTAVLLLRLSGFPAQLVVGVRRIPFAAHAWAELDGEVVNDLPQITQNYTEIDRC